MPEKEVKSPKAKPEDVAKQIQDNIMNVKTLPKGNKLYEAVKKSKAEKTA